MEYKIHEAAATAGVSVRTLHYYDEIGLLHPTRVNDAGYRFYDETALQKLAQIVFYRDLGFALADIADILQRPDYSPTEALQKQHALLRARLRQTQQLLHLVEDALKGEPTMNNQPTPQDENSLRAQYAEEVRQRWGKTPEYAQSEQKAAARTPGQTQQAQQEQNEIFAAFAACVPEGAACAKAQALCAQWQAHITQYHYTCTKPILASLAEMYTADERFQNNLDAFGPGTAQLMHDALLLYCKE